MKYNRIVNAFLGASLFMFGALKFFDPFKSWYATQILESGLSNLAYILGIAGELVVGGTYLLLLFFGNQLPLRSYTFLSGAASLTLVVIMVAGTYVHLHPNVPAEVLPLKIKPPVIPLFFLAVAVTNVIAIGRNMKKTDAGLAA